MLTIKQTSLKEANAYVYELHRHSIPTVGHKWSIACYDDGRLCGVAISGRPIARMLDDGDTIEVLRLCTDGTKDACSKLYGACARIAKDFGYKRIITYTLESEPGTSLKASGWTDCGLGGGGSWSSPSRPREIEQITLFGTSVKYSTEQNRRWERRFN